MKSLSISWCLALCLCVITGGFTQPTEEHPWVVYDGYEGPGNGQHIVFVSGDEEYRSEEALPMLAKIMAVRHGFKATVLFPIDPDTGEINPNYQENIPGLHRLEEADMMVLFTRFRNLPDDQMEHIENFIDAGKPIMGLRTATHAFQFPENDRFYKFSWNNDGGDWQGGFGRRILGETWVSHHGAHHEESTRGLINGIYEERPILNGVSDIWGPTDVYGLRNIRGSADVLVYGQSLGGMESSASPNFDKSIVPVAWTKTYTADTGNEGRVFTTTMGASVDLESEDLRRLLVNGMYWGLGMADQIPERANVDYVDPYNPTFFGFDEFRQGMRPEDFVLNR
jgi:type 1 glutamine amidotransferase